MALVPFFLFFLWTFYVSDEFLFQHLLLRLALLSECTYYNPLGQHYQQTYITLGCQQTFSITASINWLNAGCLLSFDTRPSLYRCKSWLNYTWPCPHPRQGLTQWRLNLSFFLPQESITKVVCVKAVQGSYTGVLPVIIQLTLLEVNSETERKRTSKAKTLLRLSVMRRNITSTW